MKKYLLISILSSIFFVAFSQTKYEVETKKSNYKSRTSYNKSDSIFHRNYISFCPTNLLVNEINLTYEYRFSKINSIVFFVAKTFGTKSEFYLPLTYDGAGYTDPGYIFAAFKFRVGYKIYDKTSRNFTQFSIGYYHRELDNANMHFAGNDNQNDFDYQLNFSQKEMNLHCKLSEEITFSNTVIFM